MVLLAPFPSTHRRRRPRLSSERTILEQDAAGLLLRNGDSLKWRYEQLWGVTCDVYDEKDALAAQVAKLEAEHKAAIAAAVQTVLLERHDVDLVC